MNNPQLIVKVKSDYIIYINTYGKRGKEVDSSSLKKECEGSDTLSNG